MKNYANAKEFLPKELFQQIREHFPAGMLYVSDKQERDDSRKQLIVNLSKQGMNTREIAAMIGVTVRRINQVLAKKRRRQVKWEWTD